MQKSTQTVKMSTLKPAVRFRQMDDNFKQMLSEQKKTTKQRRTRRNVKRQIPDIQPNSL